MTFSGPEWVAAVLRDQAVLSGLGLCLTSADFRRLCQLSGQVSTPKARRDALVAAGFTRYTEGWRWPCIAPSSAAPTGGPE